METCNICCLGFTDVKRSKLACPFCDFCACLHCVEQHLLNTGDAYDPKCMNCARPWSQDFIDEALPKSFRYGPLKKRRTDALMDREKSLMPVTTVLAEREIQMRQLKKTVCTLGAERRELEAKLERVRRELRQTQYAMRDVAEMRMDVRAIERKVFIKPCPQHDCRGFLNDQWCCDMCKTKVCSECHEIEEQPHTCRPEDIETAKAIKKETRPCPSCGTRIMKLSGCDQMFCTQCHTAFSWTTGRKETGRIHNPHYYEWMRQTHGSVPREPGDRPDACLQGLPDIWDLRSSLQAKKLTPWIDKLATMHRAIVHVRYVILPSLVANNDIHPDNKNADLRIRYLLKEIDEDTLRKDIFRRQKSEEKRRALHDVVSLFTDAGSDLFRRVMGARSDTDVDTIAKELDALRKYCNDATLRVAKRFGSRSCDHVNSQWDLQRIVVE